MNEIEALAVLTSIPCLGSIKIRVLLQVFGSALNALQAEPEEIMDLPGFGSKIANGWKSWRNNTAWQVDLELTHRHKVTMVPFTSPLYPKPLLEIPDYPVLLYMKGSVLESDKRSIAVVGTRQPTAYGLEMASLISQDLARQGFTIASGLARGIDTAAHYGALSAGRTIAVIGSGLADVYPRENRKLAEDIAAKGALISEFPMSTPPDRQNFPQRNRIVSGLTLGTLLIEAPEESGAMITMNKALSQGRKLFAIPGRADNPSFKGNHALIKQGKASLVETANDIVFQYEDLFGLGYKTYKRPEEPAVFLETEEKQFLSLFPSEEITIDEVANAAKMPMNRVHVLLMSLLVKKAIKEYPGKRYKKIIGCSR